MTNKALDPDLAQNNGHVPAVFKERLDVLCELILDQWIADPIHQSDDAIVDLMGPKHPLDQVRTLHLRRASFHDDGDHVMYHDVPGVLNGSWKAMGTKESQYLRDRL
jgi:hypothetical protein